MDDLYSVLPARRVPVSDLPRIDQEPPTFPHSLSGKPALVLFLRHCGCPFSEKSFKQLRSIAGAFGDRLQYYAVSHASEAEVSKSYSLLI